MHGAHRLRRMVVAGSAVAVTACSAVLSPVAAAPAEYAAGLWAQRPVVDLAFTVSPELDRVAGRETVTFVPDVAVCELVFRAWPNNPTMSREGAALTVDSAVVDGAPVTPRVEAAGAPQGAPGTLVELPLPACAEPGTPITAELGFTLTVGADADERVGRSPATGTAWFGSGFPLLAWERGRGWAREDAVAMNGEVAASEAFALRELAVTAPAEFAVTGTGRPGTVEPDGSGATVHRFSADAVRDVAVGVGRYEITTADVGGVAVHIATPASGARTEPQRWRSEIETALGRLTALLGPYPYPDLWITVTPGQSDGTEFPTSLQFGDLPARQLPALITHEIAHQWFYALVGNNQGRDPWLDESFATWAEAVAGDDVDSYRDGDADGAAIGEAMAYWVVDGGFDRYLDVVYYGGAAVLLRARDQVGADAFDAAVRAYVTANAHRIATPDDLAAAFAGLPDVLRALRSAGALR